MDLLLSDYPHSNVTSKFIPKSLIQSIKIRAEVINYIYSCCWNKVDFFVYLILKKHLKYFYFGVFYSAKILT